MNQQELKHILSSKFDFENWKDLLGMMFLKIDYLSKPIQIDAGLVKSGGQVGTIRLDDGRSLGLFKFEVADNIQIARNRKGLRDIAIKYVDQDIIHGALVFYYSENQADYRLTFVSKQTSLNGDGTLVTKETAPKRYTFLLGENEPCTTAAIRLHELVRKQTVYLTDVTDAFSVERLNKDFFNGYKERYLKFLKYLNNDIKENRDYVKKLLGRLVFLQFLQKKGWMGVSANHTNWEGGDKNYLYNLVKKYDGNDRLLSDVLEVLFFNTLNEKRTNDVANPILGNNIKIPYLNGGLFDKDDLDKKDIDFPYAYFMELMEFFGMYNFTIDENDPDDAEVGVDPEMLGHIFENLLEDNKDKGAFYTPKEIVQYMSEESIAQYLKTHVEEALHPAVEELIKQKKVNEALQNKATASAVYKLLCDVKVCDPAIGSGAFPMGVLNVLYHSRLLLYGFTKPTQEFSPANVKREIIQNNIYGVDIEQGAVDIARLRFWLALVVDEIQPEPLPNLDFKIMQGNSLLEQFEGVDLKDLLPKANEDGLLIVFDEETLLQTILNAKQLDYFSTTDHEEKHRLRNEIIKVVKDLIIERTQGKNELHAKLQPLDLAENDQFFLWHTWFADVFKNGGFDVVIGNPPYLRIQGIRESNPVFADQLVKLFKSATGSFDLYVTFVEKGLTIINNYGIVNFIMPTKWTNSTFGKGLRSVLLSKQYLPSMINFGAYQVFEASTYTGLQLFRKSEEIEYVELNRDLYDNNKLSSFLSQISPKDYVKIIPDNIEPWVLTNDKVNKILNKIKQNPLTLADVFEKIFQGIATSKDDVYFLYDSIIIDSKTVEGYSKFLKRRIKIETELVKPLLKGEDVHRYEIISTDRYVVFPYKIIDDKAELYSENELSEKFPMGYAYLKECEPELRGREKGRFNTDDSWFQFSRKQGLVYGGQTKLMAPEISLGGNFSLDSIGQYYSTTKVYGYIKKKNCPLSYEFLLGLLNSSLFWFFIKNTGYVLRGGYFTFKTNYVLPFPIPNINCIDNVCIKNIENIVNDIHFIRQHQGNSADISKELKQIDELILQIYNICEYQEIINTN